MYIHSKGGCTGESKNMKLTKEELKLILEVLGEGYPEGKIKRNKVAKIWCKLDKFLNN